MLKHLRALRPGWDIDIRCGRGKHTALVGLCRAVYHDHDPDPTTHGQYDSDITLAWNENYNRYNDRPNTKVTNCLKEVFGIDWEAGLGRYEVRYNHPSMVTAHRYLGEVCGARMGASGKFNVVLLHYQGNTSTSKKNLNHESAAAIVKAIKATGRIPVILDWDRRSPIPDNETVFCPGVGPGDIWGNFGSGDASVICEMIRLSEAFIGVDSGPGKIASATDTPSLICWKDHHPIQFHDPAPNTFHLVKHDWVGMPPINGDGGIAEFFRQHYRFGTYHGEIGLCMRAIYWLRAVLGLGNVEATVNPEDFTPVVRHGFWVHQGCVEQDYVIIKDIYEQDAYRAGLIGHKGKGEVVVDIGAHIGTFSRLWHEKNPDARIIAIECAPENWECLENNVGRFATIIKAACTYEKGPLYLLNTFAPFGQTTGGSQVVTEDDLAANMEAEYWKDRRPMKVLNLHEIMEECGVDHIDVLKMDCEHSEFSILEHGPMDRVRYILMETHNPPRWRELRDRKFKDWDIGEMFSCGACEGWHLLNPGLRG